MRKVKGSITSIAQLGPAQAALHGQGAGEVEPHRLRVDRLAVVEAHVRAQLEGDRFAVLAPLPVGGELGHEAQAGIVIHQLVAQAGEDDAPDEGARDMRIERVGVLLQADAQMLRAGGRGMQRRRQGKGCGPGEQPGAEMAGSAGHGWPPWSAAVMAAGPIGRRNAPCSAARRVLPAALAVPRAGMGASGNPSQ